MVTMTGRGPEAPGMMSNTTTIIIARKNITVRSSTDGSRSNRMVKGDTTTTTAGPLTGVINRARKYPLETIAMICGDQLGMITCL